MNHDLAIIIPARLAAVRLPNKPLADIAGLPMIVRVAKQAAKSQAGDVFIACCGKEIADVVESHGFKAIITDPSLPSGTDRVYAAFKTLNKKYANIINVQGDLPFIEPDIIAATYDALLKDGAEMTTAICKITEISKVNDPNVVKAIVTENNRALYFTRSTAPYSADVLYEHIGIYGYKPNILEAFVKAKVTTLEKTERLEQLRALENNIRIDAALVSTAPIAIDTQADLQKAIDFMRL